MDSCVRDDLTRYLIRLVGTLMSFSVRLIEN